MSLAKPMRWRLAFCLAGLLLAVCPAAHAARKALLIGNAAYENMARLIAPRNDVADLSTALQGLGFARADIYMHIDLTHGRLKEALRNFKAQVKPGDDVVIYYSGHGVQLSGNNFMLPVDAPPMSAINSEDSIKDSAERLQRMLADMEAARARFTLLIVDACRDNPMQHLGNKSIGIGSGLGVETPGNGQMILFAAGANQLAKDALTPSDRNSLFTAVLLDKLKTPGLEVRDLVLQVREDVSAKARQINHRQVPASYDQAEGTFYFAGKPAAPLDNSAELARLRTENEQLRRAPPTVVTQASPLNQHPPQISLTDWDRRLGMVELPSGQEFVMGGNERENEKPTA